MIPRKILLAVIIALVTACGEPETPDSSLSADAVYRNGKIYTVDS